MDKVSISIITVCFNSACTIEQTIQSVLQQSYSNIEYIVIDGKSTDGTIEIANKYLSRLAAFVSEPDLGIYDAMNKGIKYATGDIIGILNSDDVFFDRDVLTKVASAFAIQNTDVVYGNIVISSQANMNNHIRKWIAGKRKSFTWGWHPPHPGVFVKKTIYDVYGKYNINYKVSADFDLLLRLFEVNKVSYYYLNEFIVNMRMGGESTGSIKKILSGNINIRKSFKANRVPYLWVYPYLRFLKKLLQFI